jgi:hypothetical protein
MKDEKDENYGFLIIIYGIVVAYCLFSIREFFILGIKQSLQPESFTFSEKVGSIIIYIFLSLIGGIIVCNSKSKK